MRSLTHPRRHIRLSPHCPLAVTSHLSTSRPSDTRVCPLLADSSKHTSGHGGGEARGNACTRGSARARAVRLVAPRHASARSDSCCEGQQQSAIRSVRAPSSSSPSPAGRARAATERGSRDRPRPRRRSRPGASWEPRAVQRALMQAAGAAAGALAAAGRWRTNRRPSVVIYRAKLARQRKYVHQNTFPIPHFTGEIMFKFSVCGVPLRGA